MRHVAPLAQALRRLLAFADRLGTPPGWRIAFVPGAGHTNALMAQAAAKRIAGPREEQTDWPAVSNAERPRVNS